MESQTKDTLYQKVQRIFRNNPVIVALLFVFLLLIGIGKLTGALNSIERYYEEQILGRTPEVQKEYAELLRPLIAELDRSKNAFEKWNKKDLSLESEIILNANTKARDLLRDKSYIVHPSLRDDQDALIDHYDEWIKEYHKVRVLKEGDPNQTFVFVFTFPRESEKRFRKRLMEVEDILGKN